MARRAGFAPSHFARLFKRDEGAPFSEYVEKLRIERAKELLTTTQLGLAQVQKHCGFRARPHFYRMFKQAVGNDAGRVSPAGQVDGELRIARICMQLAGAPLLGVRRGSAY